MYVKSVWCEVWASFLSSNAQDFIEESWRTHTGSCWKRFLSSNAQDFIEEDTSAQLCADIARHS